MDKRIVLLHGWGGSPEKLEPLKDELGKKGWKTMNLRFPGLTSPAPKEVWGLQEYADYIEAKVPKIWKKYGYFVFGHSFGGRVAIKMALSKHQGLNGIVLCAPGGISRSNFIKRTFFMTMAKVGKVLLVYLPWASVYRNLLYKLARQHDYERAGGIMKDVFKKVVGEILMPQLSEIQVPALILWDKYDRVVPYQDGNKAKKLIKNAIIILFNNIGGHKLPYFHPKEVAQEVEKWWQHIN
jgi:pimeloyl-ACP methyl ester carboxylesterase